MPHRVQIAARGRQHFVYSGRSVLVTNPDGMVAGNGIEGFYVENTRLLSRLSLCVAGKEPRAIAVSPCSGDRLTGYFQLSEPEVYAVLDARVSDRLDMRIGFDSFVRDGKPRRFDLAIELDADFADSDEAEKGRRQQEAPVATEWDGARHELGFRYRHPKIRRGAIVRVLATPAPARFEGGAIVIPLEVPARGTVEVDLEVCAEGVPAQPRLDAERARLAAAIPTLVTTNAVVERAWRTATEDLASMPLGFPPGPSAPIAGIPLYQQFFGRDTLTTAWQAMLAMPAMMRDALNANAALQGKAIDDWLDEEPGRLIHQVTRGPLAEAGLTNNRRNYGDYATAPDFLIMLGQYLAWTNDVETVRRLLPAARRTLEWLERYADLDGDGLIEYQTRSSKGIKNQGWKDADDAIVDDRGRVVEPPIATVELQAYTYAALQQAALAFAFAGGDRAFALELLARARTLKRRINERFWMDDRGFYAMALGPDKSPVTSISSNPAHLLAAGVVPRSRARLVARRLLEPDMFSGWGMRTLSSAHPAYDPFSYHRGSVWPVENGTAALGFARYGLWDELHTLCEGLFALSDVFVEGRLPESVGGLPRDASHPHPGIYPASCVPQSWSASMVVLLVQSLVGMLPLAPLRMVVVDPHLPTWLPELTLRGIAIGDATIDLDMRRTASGATRYRWRASGKVRVVRQPPPAAGVGLLTRLGVAARSLI
jgi:glycogen debranching enzyme